MIQFSCGIRNKKGIAGGVWNCQTNVVCSYIIETLQVQSRAAVAIVYTNKPSLTT